MSPRAEGISLLLRQYPTAALEAMQALQVAAPWVREDDTWLRYPLFDGRLLADGTAYTPPELDREPLGHVRPAEEHQRWDAFLDDDHLGSFAMVALAQRAVDVALQGAGWSCP
jgi:hypothetical protein